MAPGPWIMLQGSWLKAHGQEKTGARARAWGTQRHIFVGHEPLALSHEPWGTSHEPPSTNHEPLAINNRLINCWFDIGIQSYPRTTIPTPASASPYWLGLGTKRVWGSYRVPFGILWQKSEKRETHICGLEGSGSPFSPTVAKNGKGH